MNIPAPCSSAFPVPSDHSNDGITILDYFAAAALTGLLAKGPIDYDEGEVVNQAFSIARSMVMASEDEIGYALSKANP